MSNNTEPFPMLQPRRVIVAVAPNGSERGVAFGIRVARLLASPLELVHVVEPLVGAPEVAMLSEIDIESAGHEVIDHAVARAQQAAPDVETAGVVLLGHPVHSLVEHAAEASMVILEHRDLNAWARIVIRSVTSGVASRAKVPVVSVPAGWSSRPGVAVTAALDDPAKGEQIVRHAALAARALGVGLEVVNVWQLPTAYEGLQLSPEDDETLGATGRAEINELLGRCAQDLVDVDVTVSVQQGRPVDALVAASKETSLMVLGRHDPALPFGSHLGPIARAVFRVSACPVMLVDLH